MPAAAAGPPGSTAWMWQGLLPRTTNPQPTASPIIWGQQQQMRRRISHFFSIPCSVTLDGEIMYFKVLFAHYTLDFCRVMLSWDSLVITLNLKRIGRDVCVLSAYAHESWDLSHIFACVCVCVRTCVIAQIVSIRPQLSVCECVSVCVLQWMSSL